MYTLWAKPESDMVLVPTLSRNEYNEPSWAQAGMAWILDTWTIRRYDTENGQKLPWYLGNCQKSVQIWTSTLQCLCFSQKSFGYITKSVMFYDNKRKEVAKIMS